MHVQSFAMFLSPSELPLVQIPRPPFQQCPQPIEPITQPVAHVKVSTVEPHKSTSAALIPAPKTNVLSTLVVFHAKSVLPTALPRAHVNLDVQIRRPGLLPVHNSVTMPADQDNK